MTWQRFLVFFAVVGVLPAQPIPPMSGAPYEKPAKHNPAEAAAPPPSRKLRLGPPAVAALAPLTAADMTKVQGREGFEPVGVHRSLQAPVARLGEEGGGAWREADAGPLWRLEIVSRDAYAMRVHFHDFAVGAGRVWLHAADGQVVGPYTGTGLFQNGDFWSDVVFGQALTIEYQPAPGAAAGGAVPFEVREISHIWREPRDLARGAAAPPWPAAALAEPVAAAKSGGAQRIGAGTPSLEQEAACHLDVTCSPEWAQSARGVGLILFEKGGGTGVCSGGLLNTRQSTFEPYFLTAAHCLDTEAVARTVLSFWGFESSTCDGPPPRLRDTPRTSGGARLLATLGDFGDPKGDFTFLEIFGELPEDVFFLGWDPNRRPFGAQVVGIHHPRGTHKRISGGRIVPDRIFGTDPATYAMVAETDGRTESGSSGSALFSEPGVVVGALSFGLKVDDVCSIDPSPAGYTHFAAIYPEIAPFLEGAGEPPPPPEDPPTVLLPGQIERFSFDPRPEPTLYSGENSFTVEVPADASRVTLTLESDDPEVDADLYARFDQDNDLSGGRVVSDYSSTSLSGNEQIVIDAASDPPLRAGTLFVSIVVFTENAPSSGELTVEIEVGSPAEPPTGETLTSGVPADFELPPVDGPTLFTGPSVYEIDVPEGATQLDVKIATLTAGVDVDLHLRRGSAPFVEDGRIVADFESTSLTGEELVTLTPDGGLAPGTYFAALSLWTENATARGEIRADVLTDSNPDGAVLLSSGEEGRFEFEAVDGPTFFGGDVFAVDVPAGSGRLVVDLFTETADVDVDLFVRLGQPPAIEDRQVVANYRAQSLTGRERIVVDAGSSPPLQAGRYFFGLAVFTAGRASSGRVAATVEAAASDVTLNAVTQAASFERGVVAPGMIVSLFGAGIGPTTGVQPGLDDSGRLPVFAGETIVLFDGIPAPLFFVRADQVNAQVPYGVAGRGAIHVAVIQDLAATNQLQVRVQDAAPALFTLSSDPGRVIALNSDGSLNSPANPARRGDFVTLFATGAGATNPPVEEGTPAPADPLARTALPVRVRFGGVARTPFFSGLAPGFAGLTQINVFVPEEGPAGASVPLTLVVGSFAAGSQPTIAVE